MRAAGDERPWPLYRCDSCGSLFFHGVSPPSYGDVYPSYSLQYYLEVGAGLNFLARCVEILRRCWQEWGSADRPPTFLDVGCGFGFSVDMARLLGWDVTGLEPSPEGAAGCELLGLPIARAYLEAAELPTTGFDLILASEVLEHVPDPVAFLRALAARIREEGVILLTTPNAGAYTRLNEKEDDGLGPGQHLFVVFPEALEQLARSVGLEPLSTAFSEGTSGAKRILALLAKRPRTVPPQVWPDRTNVEALLRRYLEDLARRAAEFPSRALYRGALYRLVELETNAGHYAEAERWSRTLDDVLQQDGCDVGELASSPPTTLEEFLARAPAFMGQYLYYRGLVRLNFQRYEEAERDFTLAEIILNILESLLSEFYVPWTRPLRLRASYHKGVALLFAGARREALAVFDTLAAKGDLPADLRRDLEWHMGVASLQLRLHDRALRHFSSLLLEEIPNLNQTQKRALVHGAQACGQFLADFTIRLDAIRAGVEQLSTIGREALSVEERYAAMLGEMSATVARAGGVLQRLEDLSAQLAKQADNFTDRLGRVAERLEGHFARVAEAAGLALRLAEAAVRPWRLLKRMLRIGRLSVTVSPDGTEATVGEVVPGRRVRVEVEPLNDGWRGIVLKPGTFRRRNQSRLRFTIMDADGNVVRTFSREASDLPDNLPTEFAFTPIPNSCGKRYTVELTSEDGMPGQCVTFWYTRGRAGTFYVDGRRQRGQLLWDLTYASPSMIDVRPVALRDLLVITPDRVGAERIGLAVRHVEVAKALQRRGFRVTLVSTQPCALTQLSPDLPVRGQPSSEELRNLARSHSYCLIQGDALRRYPVLKEVGVPLIVDLVTPIHIENLDRRGADYWESLSMMEEALRLGAAFICGNERQRLYWLGMLTALGRANPEVYKGSTDFRALVDVVPFGIPEEPPVKGKRVLREVVKGIDAEDVIFIWFGGIWDWLDPIVLIRAVALASRSCPRIKLFFPMLRRRGEEMPAMASRAVAEARECGVLGRHVFFREYPIPYEERADYLLEADVGVVSQFSHLETELAARTRVLEYIWAELPILIDRGDALSEEVARYGLGLVVEEHTEQAWANAILRLAQDAQLRDEFRRRIKDNKPRYYWTTAVEPIVRFMQRGVEPSENLGTEARLTGRS
jgi:SAM-dependent methyltransferase/glycosyltransferase involved in cell wall biosynthesis